MLLLDRILLGVPHKQRPKMLSTWLQSAWFSHQDNIKLLRDPSNPLSRDAFIELVEAQTIAKQALQSGLLDGRGTCFATLLANLDFERAKALTGWSEHHGVVVST